MKIVVGFTAGGGTDVAARVLAAKLSESFGQSFVVENRPGASGLIGSEAVAKSPADGYTLMVGSQTTLAVAPALYRKFTVDAAKDFAGISMIGISPLVAIVNPASPIKSIADLIAFAKSKSEPLMFGSGGVGTTPHMAGELFGFTAGIKMSHVAYRGEAPGVNDVLGQQIPFMFSNASVVLGNVKAGTLRGLAVTTAKRMSFAPEIPTIAETLRGKRSPSFTPHVDCGDFVVVINADKVKFTGKKLDDKVYYRHTGHPGGIKETTPRKVLGGRFPERVLEKAVERMIPRGPLGRQQMRNLRIFKGAEHPHEAQNPEVLDIAGMNRKNKVGA